MRATPPTVVRHAPAPTLHSNESVAPVALPDVRTPADTSHPDTHPGSPSSPVRSGPSPPRALGGLGPSPSPSVPSRPVDSDDSCAGGGVGWRGRRRRPRG